ncbi:MAG: hypothetical protein D6743_20255 [Calditrichaeota bacterium]|nr:MAG: hypothetical protein D6743_20255 [Calditrichota bacterium]
MAGGKVSLALAVLLLGVQTPLRAQNIHRSDVIALGMGNAYLADGRDFNAFLYNPALLARTGTQLQVEFGNVSLSLSGNFFGKKNFLRRNQGGFVSFVADARSEDVARRERAKTLHNTAEKKMVDEPADLSYSPAIVVKWWHLAAAVYTDVSYGFVVDSPGVFDEATQEFAPPAVRTRGEQDIGLILGVGSRIKWVKGLAVGGNIKYFRRRLAQRRLQPEDVGDVIDVAQAALGSAKFFGRFGLDLGATYDFGERLGLAVVMHDIVRSNNFADVEPLNLSIGLSLRPNADWKFNADIHDLLDKNDNERIDKAVAFEEGDRLRLGVQYSRLRFSRGEMPLRFGIGGGFVTAGFGAVWTPLPQVLLRFDYAVANSPRVDELEHFFQIKTLVQL